MFEITRTYHHEVNYLVKGLVTVIGLISGATAALTASSAETPGSSDGRANPTPAGTKRLLAIAAPLFVVGLIMVLSCGVKALAEASIGPENLFALRFDRPGAAQPVALVSTANSPCCCWCSPWWLSPAVVSPTSTASPCMACTAIAWSAPTSAHPTARSTELTNAYPTPSPASLTDNFALHRLCSPPDPLTPGSPESADAKPIDRKLEGPLSIINTTLNLVHGEKLAWQQRKAESFAVTPLFCGNRTEGYRDSREYGGPGGITVGTAVTISGAAANPNMGYSSSPVLGFLMAIFNVRLGAWLGNTNQHGDKAYTHPGPRHAIVPLFAEMFGLTNSRRHYVNLSDGGHFDNFGLYEIVLRRCRQVLVSDARQDGSFSFEDLGNSIRKIRVDFGINITFDKIQILPNTPEKEGLCCALGRIHYSEVDGTSPEDDGILIYIKPTLRGRGAQFPYDIYSYSKQSMTFPHESTVDQWFSESQFESYRALGSHIVSQLTASLGDRTDASFDHFHNGVRAYVAGEKPTELAPPGPSDTPAPSGPRPVPDPRISGEAA